MKLYARSRSRQSLHRSSLAARLAAYSATAGAALLAPAATEAAIVNLTAFTVGGSSTTTAPSLAPAPHAFSFETFTAGPFADIQFQFARSVTVSSSIHQDKALLQYQVGQPLRIAFASGSNAANLALGAAIEGRPFNAIGVLAATSSGQLIGKFQPHVASGAVTGYVGFRMGNTANAAYGFLRLRVTNGANNKAATISFVPLAGHDGLGGEDLIYGAFDTKADITADNFTAGSIAPVPEPSIAALGGLALLACGVIGLREQRRRREEAIA